MSITTREVLATWYKPDATLAVDEPIVYHLVPGSYAVGGMVPTGAVEDTTDDAGQTGTALWTNSDGLTPTKWVVTNPKGEQHRFVLWPGDGPITLVDLLNQEENYPWREDMTSADADILKADIFEQLANTSELDLGDAMIGTRFDAPDASARTVHDKLAEVASVQDFRRADDLTDTAPFTRALTWQQAGPFRALVVPFGEYDLSDWTEFIATGPLTMIGAGELATVISGPGAGDFIWAQSDLLLRDLTIERFGTNVALERDEVDRTPAAIYLDLLVSAERVEIDHVTFRLCSRAIWCQTLNTDQTADVPPVYSAVQLGSLRVTNCAFLNITGPAVVYSGAVKTTLAANNVFKNVVRRAIQVGRDVSTAGTVIDPDTGLPYTSEKIKFIQDLWQRTIYTGNIIDGIGSGGNNSIITLIAYGQYSQITGNILSDLVSTAAVENDGIYTKCRDSIIANNTVTRISGGAAQYPINAKGRGQSNTPLGVQGFGVKVVNNIVDMGATTRIGIRVQNELVEVNGNTVHMLPWGAGAPGTRSGIFVSSGGTDVDQDDPETAGYSDIRLVGNIINGDGVFGTIGINATSVGSRLALSDNTIRDVDTGVLVSSTPVVANTTLAQPAALNAQSIVVVSALGFAVGGSLSIARTDTEVSTTLFSPALTGALSIVVTDATGFVQNDRVSITRDDGIVQRMLIASVTGTTIGLAVALAGPAAAGKTVKSTHLINHVTTVASVNATTITLNAPFLSGPADAGNAVVHSLTYSITSQAIERNRISNPKGFGLRLLHDLPVGLLRVANNTIEDATALGTSAHGIRIQPTATIASMTVTGNDIKNIAPSGSGYGIYIDGPPVGDAFMKDNHMTGIKSLALRLDTQPTILRGTFGGTAAAVTATATTALTVAAAAGATTATVASTASMIVGSAITIALSNGLVHKATLSGVDTPAAGGIVFAPALPSGASVSAAVTVVGTATVGNGVTTTKSAVVTGAQPGMVCDAALEGMTTARVITYGVVTGPNAVTVSIRNDSGATITLDSSMTYRITARRE